MMQMQGENQAVSWSGWGTPEKASEQHMGVIQVVNTTFLLLKAPSYLSPKFFPFLGVLVKDTFKSHPELNETGSKALGACHLHSYYLGTVGV